MLAEFVKVIKVFIKHVYVFLKIHALLVQGRYHYFLIQGNKMLLDLKDKGISRELAINKIHEAQSTKFLKGLLKKGDVVIDIGANIGYYVLIESKIVGKKGKIFAIEPSKRNFKLLTKNIKLNKAKNVKTFNFAVGDKDGYVEFIETQQSNRSYVNLLSGEDATAKKYRVKMRSLDSFVKENEIEKVSLIRMDIEGFEAYALKGMQNILEKKLPDYFYIEFHPKAIRELGFNFEDILNDLERKGYVLQIAFFESDNMGIKFHWIKKMVKQMISNPKKAFEVFKNELRFLKTQDAFYDKKSLLNSSILKTKNAVACFLKRSI